MKTIAYQGTVGAFSHLTALNQFGNSSCYLAKGTFREVFEALQCGDADYGVVPIENSLAGSIYENYDLLMRYDAHIVAERITRIEHCLLAVTKDLRRIKKVLSHPKALEQCMSLLQRYPWMEPVAATNTATAAKTVAIEGDPTCAAIASKHAARTYGLQLLEAVIEDDPENYTRFLVVTTKPSVDPKAEKCSLMMRLNHTAGSLCGALEILASHQLNLTKLESRPLRGAPFEYTFYVDFDYRGRQKTEVESILSQLGADVKTLKILGFYKAGHSWTP